MADIFVFGSNLAGRHGKGAALIAVQRFGAIYGEGEGIQGDAYAIPTKDYGLHTLPLQTVATYVSRFIDYANWHPRDTFYVTRIGCGFAGYRDSDIAPLFYNAPDNCVFDTRWANYLHNRDRFHCGNL